MSSNRFISSNGTGTSTGQLSTEQKPRYRGITPDSSNIAGPTKRGGVKSNTGRESPKRFYNLMHDSRVVRGSTVELRRNIEERLPINSTSTTYRSTKTRRSSAASSATNNQSLTTRRSTAKSKPIGNESEIETNNPNTVTPHPIVGRVNIAMQTETYLEEIRAKPVATVISTQTDPLLDRPSTPLFIPQPSGPSIATQVEIDELFDFDQEIEPILETLAGKTVKQALEEVLEEEELKRFIEHKQEFEQKRNVFLAQCQRMEETERRREEEQNRRLEQSKEYEAMESDLKKRVQAQHVAKELLENLETQVLEELQARGFFYDRLVREIETEVMPALMDGMPPKIEEMYLSNKLINTVIKDVVSQMTDENQRSVEQMNESERQRIKDALAKQALDLQFTETRLEFTQAVKARREDGTLRGDIAKLLQLQLAVEPRPPKDGNVEDDDGDGDGDADDGDEEIDEALQAIIDKNNEFMDALMESIGEGPMWKAIATVIDKMVQPSIEERIELMNGFIEAFRIRTIKESLIKTFQIYSAESESDSDNPDNALQQCIVDFLQLSEFDTEKYGKYIEELKKEETIELLQTVDQLLEIKGGSNEEQIEYIQVFIQKKEKERILEAEAKAAAEKAAEEAAAEEEEE